MDEYTVSEVSKRICIVSGAQTGVDRAALDAALAEGARCGGWCPAGRVAEDGIIPACYPVRELPKGGYRDRTLKNVLDSDGTLIVYLTDLNGGTLLTSEFCRRHHKPLLLLDLDQLTGPQAVSQLDGFVRKNGIETLNVAGPRASKAPGAYQVTFKIIKSWLRGFHTP